MTVMKCSSTMYLTHDKQASKPCDMKNILKQEDYQNFWGHVKYYFGHGGFLRISNLEVISYRLQDGNTPRLIIPSR